MSPSLLRQVSPEVLYCSEALPRLDAADVSALCRQAAHGPRGRARICTHGDPSALLHEMFISMDGGGYVRPHRHLGRAESFHVLSGRATIVLFDEQGAPLERFDVGDLASGRSFYYRLDTPTFHSLVVDVGPFVFHEVTTGPFDPASSQQAPWAPEDAEAGRRFLQAALARLEAAP